MGKRNALYLIITAYSVTSAFTTDGDCVTVSGTPTTLPTPFSVITAAEPSATNPQRLQSIISSDFVPWLHHTPTCSLARMCFEAECLFSKHVAGEAPSGAVSSPLPLQKHNLVRSLTLIESESYDYSSRRPDCRRACRACVLHGSETLPAHCCEEAKGEQG